MDIDSFEELKKKVENLEGSVRERVYDSGKQRLEVRIRAPYLKNKKWDTAIFDHEEFNKAFKYIWDANDRILNQESQEEEDRIEDDMTMAELILRWFNHRINNDPFSKGTRDNYQRKIEKHLMPYFGSKLARDITTYQIQNYIDKKSDHGKLNSENEGLSRSSLNEHRTILKQSFNFARQILGILDSNPVEGCKLPKDDSEIAESMLLEELQEFIETIKGHKYEMAWLTSILTGCRRSEVTGLIWKCVDFDNDILRIKRTLHSSGDGLYFDETKSDSSNRELPLPPTLKEILQDHKKSQEEQGEKDSDSWSCTEVMADEDEIDEEIDTNLDGKNLVAFHLWELSVILSMRLPPFDRICCLY